MTSGALKSIDSALERLGRKRTLALLRKGVPTTVSQGRFDGLHLPIPTELLEIYEWHDGIDATTGAPLDDLHLFPGFYLLSASDASTNYLAFREDRRWNAAWLPVFANGGGDFYAVVCRDKHGDWGQVVHFRIDEVNHPSEFSSLNAFLGTIAAAYRTGVFFVDEHGYLEMADGAWIELASRMNQDMEYWAQA